MNARTIALFVVLVLLLGVTPLVAQEDTYIVQSSDTLWVLEGKYNGNPTQWRRIVKLNPFLDEPGRIFTDVQGRTIVLIRPGEKLVGLQELGILPIQLPIESLKLPQPEPIKVAVPVPITPAWVWWPLGLALLALIIAFGIYWILTRDPVNSRPAMVQGGVTDATAPTAIQQVAARSAGYAHATSVAPAVYQQFTVLRQTAGRIWGNMTVRYADGSSVPRRLAGERAYQAEVRFPDGHTETLYMLQGCGNDLRYGGISRYLPGPEFRFEADPAPVTVATPEPSAQPEPEPAAQAAPAPEPAPSPAAPLINEYGELVRTKDAPAKEENLLTIQYRPEENGKDSMVQADGVDVERFTFTKNGSSITFRFREVKKEPASASK